MGGESNRDSAGKLSPISGESLGKGSFWDFLSKLGLFLIFTYLSGDFRKRKRLVFSFDQLTFCESYGLIFCCRYLTEM